MDTTQPFEFFNFKKDPLLRAHAEIFAIVIEANFNHNYHQKQEYLRFSIPGYSWKKLNLKSPKLNGSHNILVWSIQIPMIIDTSSHQMEKQETEDAVVLSEKQTTGGTQQDSQYLQREKG